MLLFLCSAVDHPYDLLNGVFYRVGWVPHVMDDHVQEDLRIYELLFQLLNLLTILLHSCATTVDLRIVHFGVVFRKLLLSFIRFMSHPS
jgi:hypothetical protein